MQRNPEELYELGPAAPGSSEAPMLHYLEGFIDALQFYSDLVQDKSVPQGVTETNFASSGTLFFQNKAAMWTGIGRSQ